MIRTVSFVIRCTTNMYSYENETHIKKKGKPRMQSKVALELVLNECKYTVGISFRVVPHLYPVSEPVALRICVF